MPPPICLRQIAFGVNDHALAYNPRVQLDQGVVCAFGSDSPVEPFDPLKAFMPLSPASVLMAHRVKMVGIPKPV